MDEKQLSFEQAMQQLADITNKMQTQDIGLEDSLKYYQQGIELVKFCQNKLKDVEQKIEILKNNELESYKPE